MGYFDRIKALTVGVPASLVDFGSPRDAARMPTQASSNFITNKEQGDWAESLVFDAINSLSIDFVAVRYGKSDACVAGEEGFDVFYKEFQDELDNIGKRPDLLIFRRKDFNPGLGHDISRIHHADIEEYVKMAVAGIEVRSSAFLIDKYEEAMQLRTATHTQEALRVRDKILAEFAEELNHPQRKAFIPLLENINIDNLSIVDFKVPSWAATDRLSELRGLLKKLKGAIKEIQKRDYLSITPKVEDLKVVYRWIERFNVPHFYFQVFFDKIFGISFEQILAIISDPGKEDIMFSIEADAKNQNKTTIKIKSNSGATIAPKVDEPAHRSVRKEMDRGRLLFYVTFLGGKAYLDVDRLIHVLSEGN